MIIDGKKPSVLDSCGIGIALDGMSRQMRRDERFHRGRRWQKSIKISHLWTFGGRFQFLSWLLFRLHFFLLLCFCMYDYCLLRLNDPHPTFNSPVSRPSLSIVLVDDGPFYRQAVVASGFLRASNPVYRALLDANRLSVGYLDGIITSHELRDELPVKPIALCCEISLLILRQLLSYDLFHEPVELFRIFRCV